MRLASYVPEELIPLPLSGPIPELPHVAKVVLLKVSKILEAAGAVFVQISEGPHRLTLNS
jgi:hypothetical protein